MMSMVMMILLCVSRKSTSMQIGFEATAMMIWRRRTPWRCLLLRASAAVSAIIVCLPATNHLELGRYRQEQQSSP